MLDDLDLSSIADERMRTLIVRLLNLIDDLSSDLRDAQGEIQRLRDEARQALGRKFDYRAFHDVVLGGGSVPLPVLEGRVRRWIAASRDRQ